MNILVIGCGRVGAGLARTLDLRGHDVTVIDAPAALSTLGEGFHGTRIAGSGLDRRALDRARVERLDGLAAVTGSDEVNVVIGRLATQLFTIPRVVLGIVDPRQAEVYRRLGMQTINPVGWGVERLAELLCASELTPVASLGAGDVEILDAVIPPLLDGRPVTELAVPGETQVIAVTRNGRTVIPAPRTPLQGGDLVHVAVARASAGRLETLLGHR